MDVATKPSSQTLIKPSPSRIMVVRHGKPELDRDAGPRLNWREYRDWWAQYETGSLHPDQTPPDKLLKLISGEDVHFYSSARPRAIETATKLAQGRPITSLPVFNEAPLPPPEWSDARRYLPRTWNKIARLAWLLGHDGGDEPAVATRVRAMQAARVLDAAATEKVGGKVVLAAHGWFNRMLKKPLGELGWSCVQDGGDSYWSCRVFQRRI